MISLCTDGILFDPSKTDDEELLAKRAQWVALADKHSVGLASVAVGFASLPAVIKKVVLGMVRRPCPPTRTHLHRLLG